MSRFDGDVGDRPVSLRNSRLRAWLRARTPNFLYHRLGFVVPKARDCGDHEWYNQGEGVDACYHCEATRRTPPTAPWFSTLTERGDDATGHSSSRPNSGARSASREEPALQPHQRRILGRIPDQIRAYREGRQTLIRTLNNVWGLYTAAELRDGSNGKQFIGLYFGVSREDDLLQPWAPAGYGSSARLEAAIRALETWAIDIRETDDSGDIDAPERPDRGTR